MALICSCALLAALQGFWSSPIFNIHRNFCGQDPIFDSLDARWTLGELVGGLTLLGSNAHF